MKNLPILFSTPMVQAILDGRKTVTRRIMKHNNYSPLEEVIIVPRILELEKDWNKFRLTWEDGNDGIIACPYGQPGDILWVRETWNKYEDYFIFKASEEEPEMLRWKPSIFMPKSACRIFLEVVSVRAERLQDITEEDCIREGIKKEALNGYPAALPQFEHLWNKINGTESWNANPYVWVIENKRIDKPQTFIP